MEANRRQLLLLGTILVALAAVLYWQSTRTELTPEEFSAAMAESVRQEAGAGGAADAAPRPRAAAPGEIPAVELDSLAMAQPEPADTGRDPFRFESARAAERSAAAAPPQPVMPAAPQEPPGPPPIPLKFIGIAKQGEGRLYAVLRDERGVYYGAEGDVVEGRYRILRVSADRVELSYVDGRGRTSIPMSGGRP
ncbi:MAG: hypothetical protein H6Q09_56 [Acidobacteria bacterium]|nr:hypothetical protein [Acidobacteriota bacterium]